MYSLSALKDVVCFTIRKICLTSIYLADHCALLGPRPDRPWRWRAFGPHFYWLQILQLLLWKKAHYASICFCYPWPHSSSIRFLGVGVAITCVQPLLWLCCRCMLDQRRRHRHRVLVEFGRALSEKNSEAKVCSNDVQNQDDSYPGQGQMTMKQSCSLAFQCCFHFDLTRF